MQKFFTRTLDLNSEAYDENKPQTLFKKNYLNHFVGEANLLYTKDHFVTIQQKILSLDTSLMLEIRPPVLLNKFQKDNYEYIDKEESLSQMTTLILDNHKIIGVDIEQTNLNSYYGFNCLIQISTLDRCFIIDAILLHDALAKYLKLIFENHNIIKVFYSGSSDLQWINRDYGIFVINYFDIYVASAFLSKQKDNSLSGLLKEFCNYEITKETKKKFQVSDWRKRPLNKEQLNYAVLDIFYLIYLRDIMIEKIKANKTQEEIEIFLRRKQNACLKPFETKSFSILPFAEQFQKELSNYKRQNSELNKSKRIEWGQEKTNFLKLCKMRDDLARVIDTNPDLVCPLSNLFELAISISEENFESISSIIRNLSKPPGILCGYINYLVTTIQSSNQIEIAKQETNKNADLKYQEKLARKEKNEKKYTLQRDVYENCRVLAPDGELIAKTNRKKVNWYLGKDLATLVGEDPPTIKLKFEPSNRGRIELTELNIKTEDFQNNDRLNQCVVCGQQERLSKYQIVPSIYKQYFPLELKSHRAYDVVLICLRCREKANSESDKKRAEISQRYNVPLVELNQPLKILQSVRTIQNILISFEKHKSSMPKERKQKLKETIRTEFLTIYQDSYLSQETIKAFENFDYKEEQVKINEKFIDYFTNIGDSKDVVETNSNKDLKNIHGQLVVEKLGTNEELKQFIEEWRMLFLDTMNPQFLPYDWKLVLREKKFE